MDDDDNDNDNSPNSHLSLNSFSVDKEEPIRDSLSEQCFSLQIPLHLRLYLHRTKTKAKAKLSFDVCRFSFDVFRFNLRSMIFYEWWPGGSMRVSAHVQSFYIPTACEDKKLKIKKF